MNPYALINAGAVENIILWDGIEAYTPPEGVEAVAIPAGQTVGIGYTYANGAFTAPAPAAPSLAAQAQALLAAGLTITSTGTPALNGTYSTNAEAQSNIIAVQVYIQTNGKFPGSSGTYPWLDAAGTPHVFPSIAEFAAFSTAVADFVADCTMIILTNAGTLPSATKTIA